MCFKFWYCMFQILVLYVFKFWYLWGNLWQISTSKLKSDMYLPAVK